MADCIFCCRFFYRGLLNFLFNICRVNFYKFFSPLYLDEIVHVTQVHAMQVDREDTIYGPLNMIRILLKYILFSFQY